MPSYGTGHRRLPPRCCEDRRRIQLGCRHVVQNEISMQILTRKMEAVNATAANVIATANPGCLLQLQAGVRLHGSRQRVMHVVELLDLAYKSL